MTTKQQVEPNTYSSSSVQRKPAQHNYTCPEVYDGAAVSLVDIPDVQQKINSEVNTSRLGMNDEGNARLKARQAQVRYRDLLQ